MRTLIINSPWINDKKEYGIKSGTRWPGVRSRDRFLPYFPYPYPLASAAAVLREAGFDTVLKDAVAEEISKSECLDFVESQKPGLVVVEVLTASIYHDLEFMREVKRRTGSLTAFSGLHAGALPAEMLSHEFLDFVLVGEIDYTLRELVGFLEQGRTDWERVAGLAFKAGGEPRVNPRRLPIQDLDALPFPVRDGLPMAKYSEPLGMHRLCARIVASRGCPFRCEFCVEPFNYDGSYRHRSPRLVVEEIRMLRDRFGIQEIFFDDSIFMTEWAVKISDALIEAGLKIPWSCWVDWSITYDQLKRMKESGCFGVKFGIESTEPTVLQGSKKPVRIHKIDALITNCKKLGLLRHGSFCLGLPGDTPQSMRRTIDYACSSGLTSYQVTAATPLPGTHFYEKAKKEGWLQTDDFSQYEANTHAVLEYPGCTRSDVLSAVDLARRRKIQLLLRNPTVLWGYLVKLYKTEGPRGFLKDVVSRAAYFARPHTPSGRAS